MRRFDHNWDELEQDLDAPKLTPTYPNLRRPSLFWRSASFQTILGVSALSRFFLFAANRTTVYGLEPFLELLQSRSEPASRTRGLLTVSNHVSVVDDPLIWGALPLSFPAVHGHHNHRWTFSSHDICFTGPFRSWFFSLGQTLPTHRHAHSAYGGPFQATMTEGVRILSKIAPGDLTIAPFSHPDNSPKNYHEPAFPRDCTDPFSELPPALVPSYPSCPDDTRLYLSPSRYACNSFGWIHIFPEGMIHQSPRLPLSEVGSAALPNVDPTNTSTYQMRYFHWGVARLILEPPVAPTFVPIFVTGTDSCMHESRTFPRFIPRIRKNISVTFGSPVDVEARFGDLRRRWQELEMDALNSDEGKELKSLATSLHLKRFVLKMLQNPQSRSRLSEEATREAERVMAGEVPQEVLMDEIRALTLGHVAKTLEEHPEAVALRIECAHRVRQEILKVRRSRGYGDEDPKFGVAETWAAEGPEREGKMDDGSWIKDT